MLAMSRKSKDEEIYLWLERTIHPTYSPFDGLAPWLYKDLVVKYEDKEVGRPDWFDMPQVCQEDLDDIQVVWQVRGGSQRCSLKSFREERSRTQG